eukprot:COSAG01_NODE_98_length_26629_cov_56.866453_26_plen_244_part_00
MSATSVTSSPAAPSDALALFPPGTTELPAVFQEYIAAGGELAAIHVLPLTEENIRAAMTTLTSHSFTSLSSLVDSSGQLSPEERAVLDDIPPGAEQVDAARVALAKCLSGPNRTFISLANLLPSQLRAVALSARITPDLINEDLGKVDRVHRLTARIYKAESFNIFDNRLVPKKRPAQEDGPAGSKRLRVSDSQDVPPPPARRRQRLQRPAAVQATSEDFPLRGKPPLSKANPPETSISNCRL